MKTLRHRRDDRFKSSFFFIVSSNLARGIATPCVPSESVPSVINNFIVFLMDRLSLTLIETARAAVEALPLFVSSVEQRTAGQHPTDSAASGIVTVLLQNQQSQHPEPFPLGPISRNPLIASLCLSHPFRMTPQLTSLPAPDVGQDEVVALSVYIPPNFPKMGTTELTCNLHSPSGAPYSPSQIYPHPGLSFLCFYSQL